MKLIVILILGVTALFSATSAADPEIIYCPPVIDVTESVATTDPSWTVTQDKGRRGHFLDSISIYSGHPRDIANLVPDNTTQRNQERKYTWNLSASKQEEYWIACSYSNSLSLLTKALSKTHKKCVLTEKLLPSGTKLKTEGLECE
jgi:hypothetical protein